jgi:tetratricopeptide (TPR) repeat protein
MKFTARIPVTAALLVLLASTVGCNRLKARDELNKGIAAFKGGQYEQAVNHFQNSVRLDPAYEVGKLYLATSYAYQVVPNLTDAHNLDIAQKAIDGFQEVLANDPTDVTALKQIASIDRNIGKMEAAKEYEQKVIALDANDAEANYIIGYVDWYQSWKFATTVLGAEGKTDDGKGNAAMSKGACEKIKANNAPLIADAMPHLQRAIDINPTYDDAMSILQLSYRRRADFACGNQGVIKGDLATADEWVQKAMGARKQNELMKEKKAGGGVQM